MKKAGVQFALFIIVATIAVAQNAAREATVYRDTYGVPHIYAPTPIEGAYALGYAQAEDRLDDIYKNIRTALGCMAEAFGPDHIELDYILRVVRNAEISEKKWPEVPENIRGICEAFMAGVKTYIQEHPERVPEYALELQPWHCAAVGRAMILQWPLGTIQDDYGQRPEKPVFASNCWSVAPKRSADGSAILLTDPHLTWESLAIFYECRVHAGDMVMNGFCLTGCPMIALGHGANVGWACTTGGPDTSDVYMLKLNPNMPTQYEYEKKWEWLNIRFIRIPVKGEKEPCVKLAMDSRFGPLIAEPDLEKHVAYAGRTPYLEDIGLLEQSYNMLMAKNADEFYQALGMNHLMEQNVMFADRDGNIGYVRVGRTPIRPDGYDWSKPVPGNTKATEWLGLHPIDDLVHIMNPEQGYMQCCNISPGVMMENSPMQPDNYKPYIYNVSWDKDNHRGMRARQLLAADDSVTKEDAFNITMDVYDLFAKPWQELLKTAVDRFRQDLNNTPETAEAVQDILAWNGEYTQESTAATTVERWRKKCSGKLDTAAVREGKGLDEAGQKAALSALSETVEDMKKLYGKTKVAWGECHKVGRDGDFYPYDGADYNHTETLRCVEGIEQPKDSGQYVAHIGTMSAMLMFFKKDGIESYTCIPWGQNLDPKSPHHTDQARELFSKRIMKPTWFSKDELLKHVESEKVLKLP